MKTWLLMYSLIWVALIQIVIILFPLLGVYETYDLHLAVGVVVVSLACYVFLIVRRTACPNRIKRITKATAILAIIQGVLGLLLYASLRMGVSLPLQNIIVLAHLVNALAIITQASSSATAFDMWEQKEFAQPEENPTAASR